MIFFIQLSRLVSKRRHVNKNGKRGRFLFIRRCFETKLLSRIKTPINIHYQSSLPNLTPSASSLKINFQISYFDTQCTQVRYQYLAPEVLSVSTNTVHTPQGRKEISLKRIWEKFPLVTWKMSSVFPLPCLLFVFISCFPQRCQSYPLRSFVAQANFFFIRETHYEDRIAAATLCCYFENLVQNRPNL